MINTEQEIQKFRDYLILKKYSAETIKNYQRFLARFLEYCEKCNVLVKDISGDLLMNYKKNLQLAELSSSSVNSYIHGILTYCKYKSIGIDQDSILKIFEKNNLKKELRLISAGEVERFILTPDAKTIVGLRDRAILEVIYYSGLKISEVAVLKKINLTPDGLNVSGRKLLLPSMVINTLNKYLSKRLDNDESLLINFNSGKKVALSRQLSTRSIENIFNKYLLMAGLNNFSISDLRSSCVNNLKMENTKISIDKIYFHKEINFKGEFIELLNL